jgi:hypothetical protein
MAAKILTCYPLFSFVTGIPYAPSPLRGRGRGGGALGSINYREVFVIEKQLKKLSLTVAFLDEKAQIQFLKHWLKEIKDRRSLLEEILIAVANTYYPAAKIEKWMESRLGKDISLTPRRVAYEYRYYKAIDKRMGPYLRRIARKVKNRILIRSKRDAMKNNQGTLRGSSN